MLARFREFVDLKANKCAIDQFALDFVKLFLVGFCLFVLKVKGLRIQTSLNNFPYFAKLVIVHFENSKVDTCI